MGYVGILVIILTTVNFFRVLIESKRGIEFND